MWPTALEPAATFRSRLALQAAVVSVLALAFAPAALAVPTADFTVAGANHRPGDELTFTATVEPGPGETVAVLNWFFDDGSLPDAHIWPDLTATHTYAAPGTYSVSMEVVDGDLAPNVVVTHDIIIAPNTPPTPQFAFSPASPLIGQNVFFVSQSSDAEDPLGQLQHTWDFGDGVSTTGQGATHAYFAAGSPTVTLTVTDTEGGSAFESRSVTISAPPSQPLATPPAPTTEPLRLISPFPIVRLSGLITERGADIRRLAVRAPRGVSVAIRCRGRACPMRRGKRTMRTNATRLKRFERKLPAGTVLEVLVSRAGRIGKYTRFRIRRDRAPRRTDRCLLPGARKGTACPPSL